MATSPDMILTALQNGVTAINNLNTQLINTFPPSSASVSSASVTGTVTLTAGATSTTVSANCQSTSFVFLSPQTFHAANDAATTYITAGSAQFVIYHANNPGVDRTFGWVVVS